MASFRKTFDLSISVALSAGQSQSRISPSDSATLELSTQIIVQLRLCFLKQLEFQQPKRKQEYFFSKNILYLCFAFASVTNWCDMVIGIYLCIVFSVDLHSRDSCYIATFVVASQWKYQSSYESCIIFPVNITYAHNVYNAFIPHV